MTMYRFGDMYSCIDMCSIVDEPYTIICLSKRGGGWISCLCFNTCRSAIHALIAEDQTTSFLKGRIFLGNMFDMLEDL